MRDFFVKRHKELKDSAIYNEQVNTNNPLGFNGVFAAAFGSTMDSLWEPDQYFSVWPKKMKKEGVKAYLI